MTKKQLREIAKELKTNKLTKRVINDQLSKLKELTSEEFLNSLTNYEYSCQEGCVSMLTYYNDTERFFNRYKKEIFEMLDLCEYGFEVKTSYDKYEKNDIAWLAYELIVNDLRDALGV